MQHNGLLICSGTGKTKNIGDYIQSLASELFFEKIDELVEREKLSEYKSTEGKTKIILHGWFMHHPENWPPSNDLEPLITSFHIVPRVAEKMLSAKGIAYLKKYAPIGCRDSGTEKLLSDHGIPCYFSGCLTLALGEKYQSSEKDGKIYFVDPYYERYFIENNKIVFGKLFSFLLKSLKNFSKIYKLNKKFHRNNPSPKSFLKNLIGTASFYLAYSSKFSDNVLLQAEFIYHAVRQNRFNQEKDKFNFAEKLLNQYAKAALVVTSRIHCALPCLALETPVIFVTGEKLENDQPIRSQGRFGGIKELFRVMNYHHHSLITDDSVLNRFKKVSLPIHFENKKDYIPLKKSLIQSCKEFVKKSY